MAKLMEALGEKTLTRLERVNLMLYRGQLNWLDEFVARYNARLREEKRPPKDKRAPINRSHVIRIALGVLKDEIQRDVEAEMVRPSTFVFSRWPAKRRQKVTMGPPHRVGR